MSYDFYVYTDGSGKGEAVSCGAFAANIVSVQYPELSCTSVVGGSSCMNTTRAELTAILEGLHRLVSFFQDSHKKLSPKTTPKPTVLVVSDREDLVGAINHVFKPTTNGDLWARFNWYARIFEIEAKWVKRETNVMQSLSDKLASGFRLVLSDYIEAQTSVDHIART